MFGIVILIFIIVIMKDKDRFVVMVILQLFNEVLKVVKFLIVDEQGYFDVIVNVVRFVFMQRVGLQILIVNYGGFFECLYVLFFCFCLLIFYCI